MGNKQIFAILLAALLPFSALASENERVAPVRDPLVQAECGACHMAFQPALLPAASWEKMFSQLDRHFGDNASLSATKLPPIRSYMLTNAGRSRSGDAPERITDTSWFQRKHRFPDHVWKRPEVVTKSNCPACHKRAEAGDYEDD